MRNVFSDGSDLFCSPLFLSLCIPVRRWLMSRADVTGGQYYSSNYNTNKWAGFAAPEDIRGLT